MKLLLFDIDGTLLKPLGIGKRAFIRSLEKRFGKLKNVFNFAYDGLLDMEIVNKSLELMGVYATEEEKKGIIEDYVNNLEQEIPKNKEEWLCPNIPQILIEAREKEFALAIVTGNVKKAALLKLSSTGINNYFPSGAFGDDADERWKLVDIAIKRAKDCYKSTFDAEEILMVGDSLKDITAARKNRIKIISVATGLTPYEELKRGKPDYIFRSLKSDNFWEEIE